MDASQLSRLKELEDENQKLKQMYVDAALDIVALKEVLSGIERR
jgi:putative transposase